MCSRKVYFFFSCKSSMTKSVCIWMFINKATDGNSIDHFIKFSHIKEKKII